MINSTNPKLSIIIPCYNHGIYLDEAISSVIQSQSIFDYEIIIVNDGSTDEHTLNVLNGLDRTKYKIIHQLNQGLAAARNNGISIAKGKYILPLDSDNKLHNNYLAKAIQILENDSSIDVVYGNPMFFGNESGVRRIGEVRTSEMIDCNRIDACAVFKKTIWQKAGGYDGSMPAMGNEDWEFWINIILNGGKLYYLDDICFYYRVVIDSMSVTTTRPSFEENKDYIYKKHYDTIIKYLLKELSTQENALKYIKEHKIKALCKIFVGKSSLNGTNHFPI